jgi:phosphatidate cytidylyltransferase
MFYAGLFLMAMIALRFSFPFGVRSIVWLFATVWTTDTAAYLAGRLIGGPKLAPRISPSKTWSGTMSGIAAGALLGTFVAVRDLAAPVPILPIFVVTLVAAIASQVGDAFESVIKRHFGVKDTGGLIPGHGGVMDRLDGFIAVAVFAFVLGVARNLPSIAGGLFYWREGLNG